MDRMRGDNIYSKKEKDNTNLKCCKGEELLSNNDPNGYAAPCQKRVRTDNTQSEPAPSMCDIKEEAEAAGNSSRGPTRDEGHNSNSKDRKGVRPGWNKKKDRVKKCEEVCERMNDVLAMRKLKVGEVVWAQADKRSPAWPAVIIDPRLHAPEVVLNACAMGTICVMYFSFVRGRKREYGWIKPGMIFGFQDNVERFKGQRLGKLKDRFRAAIEEAFSERHVSDEYKGTEEPTCSATVELASPSSLEQRGSSKSPVRQCISCGKTIPLPKNIEDMKREDDQQLCTACSKVKYDGRATMIPGDCDETRAGEVLHFCSPDISGSCTVNLRDSLPEELPVFCENFEGFYLPKEHLISCQCSSCMGKKITPSAFESHSGSLSKNWKRAVKIEKTMQLLNDWIKSNKLGTWSNQCNPQTIVTQKIEDLLQVASTPLLGKWTIEKCAVCWSSGDSEYDKMIICCRCQVAVHQSCYGAQDVDDITSWVCWACKNPQVNKDCCLCPIKGGSLKKTDIGDFWVHVTCAQFQPKVSFSIKPTIGIQKIPLESFGKTCVICEQTHGACTNCFRCSTYYHAMCALRAGYHMEMHYQSRTCGWEMSLPRSYCSKHTPVDSYTGLFKIAKQAGLVSCSPELPSNRWELSTGSVQTALHSTIGEEVSCARCRVYQKGDKKRREEVVASLVRGPHPHSLDVTEEKTGAVPPDPITFSTFNERLQHLKRNENHIVCLGKSRIHGWGLFARRPIQEGEMIIEYRGELIRRSVCDVREKRYQSQNKDCYFFQVSDEVVIDATNKGNLARLINHSCQPNCFARRLAMGATRRLVFVAKENILAGQELTLDYMFDVAEREEDRVPCFCNAPNCRRYMG
ncbi:Histone-lysine N-methyltransferase [Rhynchospora pubera]|uniref:Histone-lysine N-methyltransferase n=1 Tax=Rhynchospora pubera TaxID=906938 RepID=A0AAV8HXS6_9POAL|nr:Histone-lysine N-methyltransferase [Rhynchospora pubera]